MMKVKNKLGSGMTLTGTYINYMATLSKEEAEERRKEQEKKDKILIEKLSDIFHQSWMQWSKDVASTGLNGIRLKRWESFWIPYKELSEEAKKSDRLWAERALKIMRSSR